MNWYIWTKEYIPYSFDYIYIVYDSNTRDGITNLLQTI